MSLPGNTVEELVHYWSQTDPDTEAFVSLTPDESTTPPTFQRRSLTRREVNFLCRRFAAKLRQAGIGKGDVVCVALNNSLERVVCDLGTICSGAIALNGQIFRADGEDFLQALVSSKAKAVVLDPDPSRGAWSLLQNHVSLLDADVTCPTLPHLRRIITVRRSGDPQVDFFAGLRTFPKSLERAHALTSDVAVIWTTSGSTGYSKLVTQTHANLTHIALQCRYTSKLSSGGKVANCGPLGWAGGFPLWFLGCGATRVFVDTSLQPPKDMPYALWAAVQREKCVYVFTSPMYMNSVLQRPELWRDQWRPTGICLAGQPMKKLLVTDMIANLCTNVDINYGTTECGVIATCHITDARDYEDGLTGHPGLKVEVRIVGESGEDVAEGETGQIYARSPAIHGHYVDNAEAEKKSFTPDLWFRTDDVGYRRPDGQIVHLGRQSDAITRGAYKCYPSWLESLLRQYPGIRDVCVVPVPDPVLHHEICACVVLDTNTQSASCFPPTTGQRPPSYDQADGLSLVLSLELEKSLRTFADSLLLTNPGEAQHMAPKYYVAMTSLPLTSTGKVSRKDVAAFARKQLGY